jgi:hypothetical protein
MSWLGTNSRGTSSPTERNRQRLRREDFRPQFSFSASQRLWREIFLLLSRKILFQIAFNKLEKPVVGKRVGLS